MAAGPLIPVWAGTPSAIGNVRTPKAQGPRASSVTLADFSLVKKKKINICFLNIAWGLFPFPSHHTAGRGPTAPGPCCPAPGIASMATMLEEFLKEHQVLRGES